MKNFIARGLRSASSARESQRYQSAAAVLSKLAGRLAKARAVISTSPAKSRGSRKSPTTGK